MVFGANTFRGFMEMLGPNPEPPGEDDWVVRMRADDGAVDIAARPARLAERDRRER